MIQAFDVSVYNQLQKVNVERQKLINTERKIELLREEIDLDKKNTELSILKIDREKTLRHGIQNQYAQFKSLVFQTETLPVQ